MANVSPFSYCIRVLPAVLIAAGCAVDDPTQIDGMTDGDDVGETGHSNDAGPGEGGTGGPDAPSGDDGQGDESSGGDDPSASGGSTGPDDPPGSDGGGSCEVFFEDACGSCLNTMCCSESQACAAHEPCWECVTGQGACGASSEVDALIECASVACEEPCELGTPGELPPDFGIGATVEACQGIATFIGEIGGVSPEANNAQLTMSANQGTNIWIYSRPYIEAVNFTPNDGEWRTRVLLTGDLGNGTYAATVAVAQYNAAAAMYQTLDITDIGVVVVEEFVGVQQTDGLMCNGRMIGEVQAPFGFGLDLVVIPFAAPILTANFPNAA